MTAKTHPKVVKPDAQWRAELTPLQYHVTRERGTEPAFTGEYCDEQREGVYHCVCCGQPLFESRTKYDSQSGWPSFWAPIDQKNVTLHGDHSLWMDRTEVMCSQCNAHLGHLFEDGPEPTGQHYCINSAALRLDEHG